MKIKTQFVLLIVGIVVLPILAFTGSGIYIRFFTPFWEYREEIDELVHAIKLSGIPEPPALGRFIPLLAILSVGLFVILMSALIARSITRSVTVLEEATRRIANGELELAVDIKGNNEITSLTESLNKMRRALKEEERRRYFFIMGVTHDLKTPLALIKANAEAIEDGIASEPEEQRHALNIINSKADELAGMINSLLDFVRLDSRETPRESVSLRAFLTDFAERVAADAELLHHKVESRINLPDTLMVNMDSGLVQRALDNIVNNGFRYTPDNSLLTIDAETDGARVKILIADNGNGIAEKDLPYIFELFYRGSASRSEQGMGMGLAVVKSIVDSHGWSITAENGTKENPPGGKYRGACFRITIPLT